MKRLLIALTAMCLLISGAALARNEIGIYTTEDADPANVNYDGAPGPFTAYVVLSDPWNDNTNAPIVTVGGFDCRQNCLAAIANLACIFARARHDLLAYGGWIFPARIIVCHNHQIRLARRCFAHGLALALITVTPGAEYADELARNMWAQCLDRCLDCIGRMRIIDIGWCTLRCDDCAFEPAAHRLQPAQCIQYLLRIATSCQSQPGCDQGIGGLIGTNEWQIYRAARRIKPYL